MEVALKYLHHLRLEGKAQNTLDTYKYHLAAFLTWAKEHDYTLDEIKPRNLLDFKECLLKKGKSERTVNAVLSCIRGYYDYLVLTEHATVNPVSNLLRIKVSYHRQDRLTDEQLTHFFGYIDTLQPNIRAAFYLLYASGARVSEVTNLTKEDITIDEYGRLFIDIKNAKWKSDRKIPVTCHKTALILVGYLNAIDVSSLSVFRISKRTLQWYATNFQEATGIPFCCHVLRHTFATMQLEAGTPIEKIQYMLGHKSPHVTRHYTQSAFIDVRDLAPSVWQGDADDE